MIRNDKIAELLEQRRAMDLKQLNKVLPFIMHPKQSLILWLVDIVCIPLERRQFSIHSVCGICVCTVKLYVVCLSWCVVYTGPVVLF